MSRIEKLKGLLARVEQRRAEPRLVAVSNAAQPSANTNVAAARARESPLELAPRPALQPSEQAIAPNAPSSIPPPPVAAPADRAGLGSERPAARSSSIPPLGRTPLPPPPSSTVPPSLATPAFAPAPSEQRPAGELQPAQPVRISPLPVTASDSAVRVTSTPRIEAPKSFGELLEQSLALRPKSG
ncbi:MAG: hypothetical protein JWN48_838 [Myxococcaceae bacterium]|nr:hypothetical protein [Myxococcaceae bacterium]